jgi:predicted nuclease of restriction endonuclease-like (RecB) superfamily
VFWQLAAELRRPEKWLPWKQVTDKRRIEKADPYEPLLAGIVALLEESRRAAGRAINSILTSAYWEIGRRIVEEEQRGRRKANYGDQLLEQLASDLTARFGKGFSRTNVFQMRQFYLAFGEIVQAPSEQSSTLPKVQTASGQLRSFPLSWSHYVRLLSVQDLLARRFYEAQALSSGWSVRQLDRQIASQFYERSRVVRRNLVVKRHPEEDLTPDEHIRDPFVLEFLGLKDEYSEHELEEALILRLEHFLLELGDDFAFMARQKRLRVGDDWYRVDLLFFHRRLRCLVLIDLKLGRFSHADAGQMNFYLNYAREHWTRPDENPPIGLILCSERNEAVAHYALGNLQNRVMAREYRLTLPEESVLVREISDTRRALQLRARPSPPPGS